jgi:nitrate/nitrite transport system substrate-binding protein
LRQKEIAAATRPITRRVATGGVAGLLAGLPEAWRGAVYASEAPEKPNVRFGYVAVQSCAPIIIGHEKGFFKKYGVASSVSKENGWAAIRDKLSSGENQASHFKHSQGVSTSLGIGGSARIPIVSPWTMTRNGSVFLVSLRVADKPNADPKSWVTPIRKARQAGSSFVIALPIPAGFHAMMYRYVLGAAGIRPDVDMKFIILPPAQMVQNMRVGAMSACAMVEPWGTRGIREKVAYVAFFGNDYWPGHPIKTLAFLERYANENPKTVLAVLRGMHDASVWCDNPANHPELARILSSTNYLHSPPDTFLPILRGHFDYGMGKVVDKPAHRLRYSQENCNYPQPKEMMWFLTQYRRWGLLAAPPNYQAAVKQVCRTDLYIAAMKGIGFTAYKQDDAPFSVVDGKVFNPAEPEKYAASFAVNAMKR